MGKLYTGVPGWGDVGRLYTGVHGWGDVGRLYTGVPGWSDVGDCIQVYLGGVSRRLLAFFCYQS